MADYKQGTRQMTVSTPLGPDKLLLIGFEGNEQISGIFNFRLELVAKNTTKIEFDKLLGKELAVTMLIDNESPGGEPKERYFRGICRRFAQGQRDEEFTSYRAEIVPMFWLTTRTAQSRIFQQKSVPDILKAVLAGMKVTYELDGTFEKREYCVQYRETDFNFVSRLMEEEGIFYFFKHNKDGHEMVIANSARVHANVPGVSKVQWDVVDGAQRESKHIHDWVKLQDVRSGKFTMWDQSFQRPNDNFEAKKNTLGSVAVGTVTHKLEVAGNEKFEIYDFPGEVAQRFDGIDKGGGEQPSELGKISTDATRTVGLRMQAETLAGLVIEASSNCNQFVSGHKFTLDKHFDANGRYVITAIHHMAHGGNTYRSGREEPFEYSNSFTCIPDALPFRPQRTTAKPSIMGVQTAIVVGPPGEEIFTDKYGRVKVQFPWDRESAADANSSCWLRVGTPWAGKGWGSIHIPRVGHEVIVQFIEGDPDAPIIIGSVYNAAATPPYKLPDEKTKSTLKSNSSKGGKGFNELRFEDKAKAEQIFIHAQRNLDVRVRNSMKETNYGNRHERIGWKTDDGAGGSHFVTVHQDENTHVEKIHYEKVDDASHLTVLGETTERFDKSLKTAIKDSHVLNAKESIIETKDQISLKTGKLVAQGANSVGILGQQIVLEGTTICLKSGGNFITINSGGIQIQGTTVMINSGGCAMPAEKPAALPDISVEEPFDAKAADDGKTGGLLNTKGHTHTQQTRGGGPVTLQKAPPYTPPPASSGPLAGGVGCVEPPPSPIVVCGGPYEMKDQEGRKANAGLTIEVVAKSAFGSDTITVSSKKGCSCAGAKVKIGATSGALNAPIKVDGWVVGLNPFELICLLGGVTPKSHPLQLTCGKDESSIASGEVIVYPSDKVEIKADLNELLRKFPAVEKAFDLITTVMCKLTGKNVDMTKGISFKAGMGQVSIPLPALAFGYEAQWKEYGTANAPSTDPNEIWRVYYAWKATLSVTIGVEFKFDIISVGGALSGVGAGAVAFYNALKDYIEFEPPIYLSLKAEISGGGSIGYEEKVIGAIEIKGTGTIAVGASITTEFVSVSCEASTAVSSSIIAEASRTGVAFRYELFKWGGVVGKASAKLTLGDFISVGFDESVQLVAEAGPLSSGPIP